MGHNERFVGSGLLAWLQRGQMACTVDLESRQIVVLVSPNWTRRSCIHLHLQDEDLGVASGTDRRLLGWLG
jgi:hypothetical protein